MERKFGSYTENLIVKGDKIYKKGLNSTLDHYSSMAISNGDLIYDERRITLIDRYTTMYIREASDSIISVSSGTTRTKTREIEHVTVSVNKVKINLRDPIFM